MDSRQPISEITACIASEMERMGYAPSSIKSLRSSAKHLERYILSKTGQPFFSEELGAAYLEEIIGFPFSEPRPLTAPENYRVRCVRRIGEYQLHGIVSRLRFKTAPSVENWALEDTALIHAYIDAVQTADNSEATKKLRYNHIRKFYYFLSSCELPGIQGISPQIISLYVESLQGTSPVYVKHLLGTLRNYFRFAYKSGGVEQDWSQSVPSVISPKNISVPALWSQEEIECILSSIDRGNPTGKRNYAIILLVVQLGLRISDVAGLRLSSLKWERKELELVQHKTSKRVVLPLLDDVGWAIIDYIQHSRPKVENPILFMSTKAPYENLSPSAVGSILYRQLQRCGIPAKEGVASGMHSLRHALARRLLESGTPLSTVADIMGHSSFASTSPYLKVDIQALRECALSLKEETAND